MIEAIVLPGIGNSDEHHWQSIWERQDPLMHRFQPKDWEQPDLADWFEALEWELTRCVSTPVLIAHSLGCLLVAHWARKTDHFIRGAFLVAPPDPQSPVFPQEAEGFAFPVRNPLKFPSMVVASSNDPYADVDYSRRLAGDWQADFTLAGELGHINASGGAGEWPEGQEIFRKFIDTLPY